MFSFFYFVSPFPLKFDGVFTLLSFIFRANGFGENFENFPYKIIMIRIYF